MYLDYTDEVMNIYSNAPCPPLFVIHNATEFSKWTDWAKDFKENDYKGIQPFGLQFDMDKGVEGFMSYYDNMRKR